MSDGPPLVFPLFKPTDHPAKLESSSQRPSVRLGLVKPSVRPLSVCLWHGWKTGDGLLPAMTAAAAATAAAAIGPLFRVASNLEYVDLLGRPKSWSDCILGSLQLRINVESILISGIISALKTLELAAQ